MGLRGCIQGTNYRLSYFISEECQSARPLDSLEQFKDYEGLCCRGSFLTWYTKLMSIYTKTGDKGQTSIFGGGRVPKSHPQVKAYGTIDELTSFIGLVAAKVQKNGSPNEDTAFLTKIQKDLYQMMAMLAGAKLTITEEEKEIQNFEKKIDEFDKQLPKLTRFILPGGTELAGWFHVLRTTCRRSERETVEFFLSNTSHTIDEDSQRIMLKYLNRLSDLFFMYARKYSEGKEILT